MKSFLKVLTNLFLVMGFVFSVAGCKANGEENAEPNVPNTEEQLPEPDGGEEENGETPVPEEGEGDNENPTPDQGDESVEEETPKEPTPEQKEENKDFGNWH
ncbi:MAG: hypothetical protein IJY05_02840 [Clostridia bacterium]|nr:hypothetical protein [Clostridia bacterium]